MLAKFKIIIAVFITNYFTYIYIKFSLLLIDLHIIVVSVYIKECCDCSLQYISAMLLLGQVKEMQLQRVATYKIQFVDNLIDRASKLMAANITFERGLRKNNSDVYYQTLTEFQRHITYIRLLVYKNGEIEEDLYKKLDELFILIKVSDPENHLDDIRTLTIKCFDLAQTIIKNEKEKILELKT